MGMNDGYKLLLSGFTVKYKRSMGNKGYKWFCRISLTVYFLFFFVFGNKILKDNFYIITALFSVVLIILILKIIEFRYNYGLKKEIRLKKEIYIKPENKNLCFYNAEDQKKILELQYRNNDFLYRKGIFGGLVLVIMGEIKEYSFYISEKDKKSDYKRFFDDFGKNYIERMKFCTWKNAGRLFYLLYILIICFFFIKDIFFNV